MYETVTAEDILQALNRREIKSRPGLAYDIGARTSNRSREVLNNKTIEELNNSSRTSEDVQMGKTLLASVASPLEKQGLGQEVVGNDITPARTSSRYTGITVQHCAPAPHSKRPGIKLAVSVQTADMAKHGHLFLLTAELKRYARLREIKSKLDDSAAFAQLLEQAKREIHDSQDHDMVMGRLHLRGKRSAWIPNCLAIGRMQAGQVCQVVLFLDDEDFTIQLNTALTPAQQNLYVTTGQWGTIAHPNSHSPSLQTLIRERFGS